jgi:serine/threonine protein phosphatase PrpC
MYALLTAERVVFLCHQVARMCQGRMHALVADEYKKAGSGKSATAAAQEPAWEEVMKKGFARMDDEAASRAASSSSNGGFACRCELQKPARCDHAGSTAVVAVVSPTSVVVANAGDSRAVLSRAGVPVPLSVDHKVSFASSIARARTTLVVSCRLTAPVPTALLDRLLFRVLLTLSAYPFASA